MIEVMIKAADNGSLLREEHKEQLWNLAVEVVVYCIEINRSGSDSE